MATVASLHEFVHTAPSMSALAVTRRSEEVGGGGVAVWMRAVVEPFRCRMPATRLVGLAAARTCSKTLAAERVAGIMYSIPHAESTR